MKTRELIEYAKDNGYDNVQFWCQKKIIPGQFWDAFFVFAKNTAAGKNSFMPISQIEKIFGDDSEFVDVTDVEQYGKVILASFVISGKIRTAISV